METKTKLGRPAIMSIQVYANLKEAFPDIRTRRGILNKFWETNAFRVIQEMMENGVEGLEFLVNKTEETINDGVLRELGKFSPADIRALAIQICEGAKSEKRTVRQWAALLRLVRLSEAVSENIDQGAD